MALERADWPCVRRSCVGGDNQRRGGVRRHPKSGGVIRSSESRDGWCDRVSSLLARPAEVLFTVRLIGVGEQYLYRGLLLILAIKGELQTVGLALLSLSFGFWHLPDELGEGT